MLDPIEDMEIKDAGLVDITKVMFVCLIFKHQQLYVVFLIK